MMKRSAVATLGNNMLVSGTLGDDTLGGGTLGNNMLGGGTLGDDTLGGGTLNNNALGGGKRRCGLGAARAIHLCARSLRAGVIPATGGLPLVGPGAAPW